MIPDSVLLGLPDAVRVPDTEGDHVTVTEPERLRDSALVVLTVHEPVDVWDQVVPVLLTVPVHDGDGGDFVRVGVKESAAVKVTERVAVGRRLSELEVV